MNIDRIGIIGQGFVGTAIKHGFDAKADLRIETFDIGKPDLSTKGSTKEVVEVCDIIFVCVPTPMKSNGECDVSIVESVLDEISKALTVGECIAVIKSTVIPGSTAKWNLKYRDSGLNVVFNPEFLVEASAKEDFLNQTRIILGGEPKYTNSIAELYRRAFWCAIVQVDSTTAESVKYMTNTFLAVKVSFANEIYQVCQNLGINYEILKDLVCLDPRINHNHFQVPGPDGNTGFGGHCFPKDLIAFLNFAKSLGVNPSMLEATWEKNLEVRTDRDWEEMKGRAVS